jgi:hypothetical protein
MQGTGGQVGPDVRANARVASAGTEHESCRMLRERFGNLMAAIGYLKDLEYIKKARYVFFFSLMKRSKNHPTEQNWLKTPS